jgi:hypothetical protein
MNQPTAAKTAMPPDEDFFRTLEVERTQALVARDVIAIRRLHATDYELISVPGRVMSLERYLSLMAIDVFYASWEHGAIKVQLSEAMAAVRYQARITFPSGKVVDCWHTDIYQLRGLGPDGLLVPSHAAAARVSTTGRTPVRPNPSLKRSTNGRPPGPVWRYAVLFRQPGPGGLPLASG